MGRHQNQLPRRFRAQDLGKRHRAGLALTLAGLLLISLQLGVSARPAVQSVPIDPDIYGTWVCASWEDDGPQSVRHLGLGGGISWTRTLTESQAVNAPLAYYGEACYDLGQRVPPEQPVDGKIALIARGTCSFYTKLSIALEAGAIGVLMFTDEQRPKVIMGCGNPDPCNQIDLLSLMIDHQPGAELRDLLRSGTDVTVTMGCEPRHEALMPLVIRRR